MPNLPPGCSLADIEGPSMRSLSWGAEDGKVCAACGRDTEDLEEGVCPRCFREQEQEDAVSGVP